MRLKILLIAVVLLFLFTRLYKISEIPGSVYWDEASIGVNAYSVLTTGRDEWGKFMPVHFKAFGEYKLPIYIYSTAITEELFGLNIFAVRLPAVVYSLGVILLVYFLAGKLFKQDNISLWSAFLLTITPWFFIFSRTGYEATAGLFYFLLGILLWLHFEKSPFSLILATLAFIASIYSYNSYRIIVPLMLVYLIIYTLKNNLSEKNIKWLIVVSTLFLISLIPIIQLYNQGGAVRLETVGIFNPQVGRIDTTVEFIKNYLSHFNPQFLFLNGDPNLRSQLPGFGELYLFEAPFLLLGLLVLIRQKSLKSLLLVFGLLMSFVPAAITKQSPHALRSLSAVSFVSIVSALGISFFSEYLKGFKNTKILYYLYNLILVLIFSTFFAVYFINFLKNYNQESFLNWQQPYKELFDKYSAEFKNYDHIIISDRYNQPYILTLFYQKYNMNKFRKEVSYNQTIRKATSLVAGFGKFIFTNIDYYNLPKGKNLIFAHPNGRMSEIKEDNLIFGPDGSIVFYMYKYDKK